MSKGKDLTKIVERLEALEERLGVSIEAVYAVYTENGSLIVNYDLHSRDGGQLSTNISIKLAVYDGAGRLIHEEGRWHGEEEFRGTPVRAVFICAKSGCASRPAIVFRQ